MRRSSTPVWATLFAWLLAAPAAAAVSVDAGADLEAVWPQAQLAGSLSGLQSVDFWIADGDGALENYVMTYDEGSDLGSFGPLFDSLSQLWGWPSDLIEVGGTVYGVDTYFERLYTLDPATALVTPLTAALGSGSWDTRLGSLAYDPGTDRLYSVDWRLSSNRLFAVERSTGETVPPGGGPLLSGLPFADVLGLAWDASSGLLYLYDADSGEIHTLDPTTGATDFVVAPDHGSGLYYDELAFYEGELYGSLYRVDGGTDVVQVRRIDLATGAARDVGPAIANSDGHSLLIHSMPERVEWSVDSGPGTVEFADAGDPATAATFSHKGSYVLRLTAYSDPPTSDTVSVELRLRPRVASGAWPAWALLAASLVGVGLALRPSPAL